MTFSPWSIARGVLESSATAVWLLEDVDVTERLARSFSTRLQHLQDQQSYARDALKRDPEITEFKQALPIIGERVTHLISAAKDFGIPQKRDRNDRLIGFGSGMPNIMEMVDKQLDEGGTYRLLSAVVHARTWALLPTGFRRVDTGSGITLEQNLTVDSARFLVIRVIVWFARPTWSYFSLNGWDCKRLAAVLESTYDYAALVEDTRFWRTSSP